MSIVYKRKNRSIGIHNLKKLSPGKDDLSELKSVSFMLFSICDFLLLFVMGDFFGILLGLLDRLRSWGCKVVN